MTHQQQNAESPETKPFSLSLKIPPPLYLLLGGSLIYLVSRRTSPTKPQNRWRWLGLLLVALGLGLDIHALLAFRKRKTTPNPLRPDKAEHLVIEGAYRFTRNPMYLGMVLILSGWSLLRTSLSGLLVVPAFIWTLNQVQIIPEEQFLKQKFGRPYRNYLKQVRRWI